MKKFVIEFVDPNTRCVFDELIIETSKVEELREIVDPGGQDLRLSAIYYLNKQELDQIEVLLGVRIDRVPGEPQLRPWVFVDELPYKVHTNRELALMLKGEKPLAVFHEMLPSNPDYELIPERFFAPYVADGFFSTSEFISLHPSGGEMRFVLYAAKGEEWRIHAYILLDRTVRLAGWNAGFTRMEGSLLGYEDWQNDIYISRTYKK